MALLHRFYCTNKPDPVVQDFKWLPNVALNFLSPNMANTLMFLLQNMWVAFRKTYSHFCSKNIKVFENPLATTANEFVINELVKLTMLWTTGPRSTTKKKRLKRMTETPTVGTERWWCKLELLDPNFANTNVLESMAI